MQDNKENTAENEQTTSEKIDQIKEFGTDQTKKNPIRVLTIIGQIEGHTIVPSQSKATKYEHVIPILTEVEQDVAAGGLLVIMNTVGGDVEAGLAISELIRGMSKPSVSLVLGGGHSIGVPLAVCTDYSFIVPTASMTIHPLRTTGLFITVPQSFEYYNKMQERVIKFICANSSISEERLKELMNNKNQLADDIGTVLIGKQSVEEGLIDEVGGLKEALDKLKSMLGQPKGKSRPSIESGKRTVSRVEAAGRGKR